MYGIGAAIAGKAGSYISEGPKAEFDASHDHRKNKEWQVNGRNPGNEYSVVLLDTRASDPSLGRRRAAGQVCMQCYQAYGDPGLRI